MNTKRVKNQKTPFETWLSDLVKDHRETASTGTWDGNPLSEYYESCRRLNSAFGISTILTRDVGYHSSGWMKTPELERCLHLSIAFFDPASGSPISQDHATATLLIKAMFFPSVKWTWTEPPSGDVAMQHDLWHYRLFCNEKWQPLNPPGEELTSFGWKCFGDVQEAIAKFGLKPNVS